MTSKAQNIINALEALGIEQPVIVETGTIRDTSEAFEQGDGHSTRFIAEWVRHNGGLFYSIDTDIKVAAKYLFECDLRSSVQLKEGYSTDVLPTIEKIDFAYLDSANDADNCLAEFLIVWDKVTSGGCVMVDDCNEASVELLKGDKLMPYLREHNIEYATLDTNQIVIPKP